MQQLFNVPEDIIFYAFRYALGRMTYCTGDVTAEIVKYAPFFSYKVREKMIEEIEQAEDKKELGMSIDKNHWLIAKQALKRAR